MKSANTQISTYIHVSGAGFISFCGEEGKESECWGGNCVDRKNKSLCYKNHFQGTKLISTESPKISASHEPSAVRPRPNATPGHTPETYVVTQIPKHSRTHL